MAKTIEEQRKRQREQQARMVERQRAKAIAKANDPAYREKQHQKKLKRMEKAKAKRLEKLSSPEYQAEQRKKASDRQARQMEKAKTKALTAKKRKSTSSRGLKGRTPNAEEKRIMDALGSLPCIACFNQGRHTELISLHHNNGRTIPFAHADSLPLCAHHHDTPADKEVIDKYPDLIPVHARGSIGGKAAWRKVNGHEHALLKQCYDMAGLTMPVELSLRLSHSE